MPINSHNVESGDFYETMHVNEHLSPLRDRTFVLCDPLSLLEMLVVVGYHSLMRFLKLYSWPKNCDVCVDGPCNVHKTLSSYTLTSIFL